MCSIRCGILTTGGSYHERRACHVHEFQRRTLLNLKDALWPLPSNITDRSPSAALWRLGRDGLQHALLAELKYDQPSRRGEMNVEV